MIQWLTRTQTLVKETGPQNPILADRTNSRVYAAMCRPSVVCLWRMYCGETVRHRAKVTIGSLYEVVYEKSINTKMNDLDLCLEVVNLRPYQPLRNIRHWISRKPLEIDASQWPPTWNGLQGIEWSHVRWRHVTLKGQTRDPNTLRAISWQQLEMLFSNNRLLDHSLL